MVLMFQTFLAKVSRAEKARDAGDGANVIVVHHAHVNRTDGLAIFRF